MAKHTVSSARFRRVDVDEYDENKFVDEEEGGDGQAGPDEGEVDSCLRQYPSAAGRDGSGTGTGGGRVEDQGRGGRGRDRARTGPRPREGKGRAEGPVWFRRLPVLIRPAQGTCWPRCRRL